MPFSVTFWLLFTCIKLLDFVHEIKLWRQRHTIKWNYKIWCAKKKTINQLARNTRTIIVEHRKLYEPRPKLMIYLCNNLQKTKLLLHSCDVVLYNVLHSIPSLLAFDSANNMGGFNLYHSYKNTFFSNMNSHLWWKYLRRFGYRYIHHSHLIAIAWWWKSKTKENTNPERWFRLITIIFNQSQPNYDEQK